MGTLDNLLLTEYLFFEEGLIMSTGKPEDFCWNESNHSIPADRGGWIHYLINTRGLLLLKNAWNTIKLAIEDVADQILDSYLLISTSIDISSIIISIPIIILIGAIELISTYIISI